MLQLIKNWLELNQYKNYRIIFYGYTVVLLFLTQAPISSKSETSLLQYFKFPHSDKVVHFLFFFVLTLLYYLAYPTVKKFKLFLVPFLVGVLIEILQYLLDVGRTFDLLDILANTLGVGVGLYCIKHMKS